MPPAVNESRHKLSLFREPQVRFGRCDFRRSMCGILYIVETA